MKRLFSQNELYQFILLNRFTFGHISSGKKLYAMIRYIQIILGSLWLCSLSINILEAQNGNGQLQPLIALKNGSFEDRPRSGTESSGGPSGWNDCGAMYETAPDIHPAMGDSSFFEVNVKATDGKTYVGMVVRDNRTWESIGQRLQTPMLAGKCYNFNVNLARSDRYISFSKTSSQKVNYKRGAVLRVWGGNRACGKDELLDETDVVENSDWRLYNLRLEPSRNYSFIMLEVFYKTPVIAEYNGNMLLDNASNLIPVPCSEAPKPPIEEVIVAAKDPVKPPPTKKPKPNKPTGTQTTPPTEDPTKDAGKPAKKEKEFVKELAETIVVGQEITLNKLYFDADSAILSDRYHPIIDDVYEFLLENKKITIEVGGHTNNLCEETFCNKLSEDRAATVANYLINRGIDPKRVFYKGYGKNKPKFSNSTPTNRRRNQRVEIKILSKN
jgi:outer membrane protein OmpA-like peptidoglycan-associated protein